MDSVPFFVLCCVDVDVWVFLFFFFRYEFVMEQFRVEKWR